MKTLLFLIPLYLLPLVVRSDVVLTILIFTFVLGILAIGFNIVFGGAGQLTMFHAAAFGIGSYVTFLSMLRFAIPFWLGFVVAVMIVILVSIVIGWICFKFRLKEFYFAVVTLAFAELCRLVALNWTSVTNGTLGMLVLEKPTVWLPGSGVVKIEQTVPWYFLTLVCTDRSPDLLRAAGALLDRPEFLRDPPQRRSRADARDRYLPLQAAGLHDIQRDRRLCRRALRFLHRLYRALLSCGGAVARRHRHGAAGRRIDDPGAGGRRAGADLTAASDRTASPKCASRSTA